MSPCEGAGREVCGAETQCFSREITPPAAVGGPRSAVVPRHFMHREFGSPRTLCAMFITFEGPDGSGKTTQFRRLAARLTAQGRAVLPVREPGGTELGESVRELLLQGRGGVMDARAELLLFCASRAQLVSERILPHLEAGGVVLCDRFADSTLAYQGYGRGLDLKVLRDVLNFATRERWPDLTLYFDLEVETALARRNADGEVNRLDAESLDFHRRVRAGYLELAARDPQRWCIIDARPPADAVEHAVNDAVAAHLAMGDRPS